jgi:hypothetical protein
VYVASLLVAALMAIASVAGLLFGGALYGDRTALLPAFLGQDLLNLVVGLPLLLGSMWLTRGGSAIGPLVWLGALFYVVYDYAFYVLGAPVTVFFLPYLALVTVSGYTAVALAARVDADRVRERYAGVVPRHVVGGFLVVVAVLFIALWSTGIAGAVAGATQPDAISRIVWTLDLTIQLPALLVGGVLLWRGRPLGFVVAPGLLLQAAAYLLGLSAICILGTSPTGHAVTVVDWAPGLVVGGLALALIAFFVRAGESAPAPAGRVARSVRPGSAA